ncbi:MAG: transcription termination/antitermination protein NusA [Clostridia bacterium]|nr:transcription termination/antitermination protein NusA [Clostridia bacterium]
MANELMAALELLEKEKNIKKEDLLEALKPPLINAYKKYYGAGENVFVEIDDNGKITVHEKRNVVEEAEDYDYEISLDEALTINPAAKVGDVLDIETTPKDFGRIAAQNAKQMMVQYIREAERSKAYLEYAEKENDIVTAVVQKPERRGLLLQIGTLETLMPSHEQVPGEVYKNGDKIQVYVLEVKNTAKGLQVLVSRTHPGLVRRLFEREVPEIADGTVKIKSIAREAGSRTKIAVFSDNPKVDPVGSCVGQKGVRIAGILESLGNEKIDIIKYSEDPAEFITESLSPAKVLSAEINEEEKSAAVVVPDFQLSLAIGKEGQNARLAAKLTGWKIDIKSDK